MNSSSPDPSSPPSNPDPSLSTRTIRSSAWIFAIQMLTRVGLLLQVVVLVRYLSPAEFGVVGIALLSLAIIRTFTEGGMEAALIQRSHETDDHLHTAWTVQVVRGVITALLLFLIAPAYTSFFGEPEAANFIRAFAIPILAGGFVNIGVVVHKRNVQYEKLIAFESVPPLLGMVTTIVLAALWGNVWAFAIGKIAEGMSRLVISFMVHPFRPRVRFDRNHFGELFRFGKWVYASQICVFLLNHGDDILVGRVLGATSLGFYQMGFRIARMPVTEVNFTLSKVLFPAFSRLQDDRPRLKEAYLRVITLVLSVTLPFSLGILVLAPYAVPAILGPDWQPAIPVVQTFSILGLLVSIGSSTVNVFRAVGKPSIVTKAQAVRAAIMFALIGPFMAYGGLMGAAVAVVLSELAIGGYLVSSVLAEINASFREACRCCVGQFAAAVMMALGIAWLGGALAIEASIVGLISLGAWGICLYFGFACLFDAVLQLELRSTVLNIASRCRS